MSDICIKARKVEKPSKTKETSRDVPCRQGKRGQGVEYHLGTSKHMSLLDTFMQRKASVEQKSRYVRVSLNSGIVYLDMIVVVVVVVSDSKVSKKFTPQEQTADPYLGLTLFEGERWY